MQQRRVILEHPKKSCIFGNDLPFVLIAGPCVMESRAHALEVSAALLEITEACGVKFVYKSSFDKANRSSFKGERGIGLEDSLPIFSDIRKKCPILTDIHDPAQCALLAPVIDILQIPAFLCRQTDLLRAAARTGKIVNVKKGQFLAPWDMQHVAEKISAEGHHDILLTERGSSFGYNMLVNDMRGLPIMAETGYPVVFDATHSVQMPGGKGHASGGDRRMVPVVARAATSIGVAALFIETHPDPDKAPSDGPNMLALKDLPSLLKTLIKIDRVAKANPIMLA